MLDKIEKTLHSIGWNPWGKNETTLFFDSPGYNGCVEYVSHQSVETDRETEKTMKRIEDRIHDERFNVVMIAISDHYCETYVDGEPLDISIPASPTFLNEIRTLKEEGIT